MDETKTKNKIGLKYKFKYYGWPIDTWSLGLENIKETRRHQIEHKNHVNNNKNTTYKHTVRKTRAENPNKINNKIRSIQSPIDTLV